jgi:hypothetical protein
MALTSDIVEGWRHPRRVVRRHLARGVSEPFAFSLLAVFLLVAFIAQWPVASRAVHLQPEVLMTQRLVAAGLGVLATIPLWYGLAALSHLVARAFGGQGGWYGARIALFWSLVAISPMVLLQGLVGGFLGQGVQATALGLVVLAAFLALWLAAMREAEGI